MYSFRQARMLVASKYASGVRLGGLEDDRDYDVLLDKPLTDMVVLVSKKDGRIHEEIYFDVAERLSRMRPIVSLV